MDISDWNIDPKEIEKKITKKTKAIIPVHLHGRPCKMDEIGEIARKHKLFVVEDAAHAIEAVYHGKEVGNISDLTVFSFYATKNMTTGEGGMVTTNNKNWAEMIKFYVSTAYLLMLSAVLGQSVQTLPSDPARFQIQYD